MAHKDVFSYLFLPSYPALSCAGRQAGPSRAVAVVRTNPARPHERAQQSERMQATLESFHLERKTHLLFTSKIVSVIIVSRARYARTHACTHRSLPKVV